MVAENQRGQLLASTTGSSEGRQRASRLITLFVPLLNPPRDLFERWIKRPSRNVEEFITHNNAFLRTRGRGRIDNACPGLLSVRREPPSGERGRLSLGLRIEDAGKLAGSRRAIH